MPNVVIVDDQSTDRQILAQLIQSIGEDIQVEAFGEPAKALEWLRSNQPDLILVDYRMPGMDGLAFLEACEEFPSCSGIPVIIITVIQSSELRYQALEAGATDFLTKPLDVQECRARCRNLLTLRRQQLTIARHAQRLAVARQRMGRALRTLSLGNELLVRTHDEHALVEGICTLVVEQGGYPFAWVGFLAGAGETAIQGVASARAGSESLVAEAEPLPEEQLKEVAETGIPLVINDLAADASYQAWATSLARQGVGGVLVLPVRMEGYAPGVLVVYTAKAGQFDEDEVELLARTADNMGYGVASRRAEAERERAEKDADFLANFDPLTGLPNRAGLLKRLQGLNEIPGRPPAAMLVINLDRFKLVNDTGGHQTGDQVLLQVVSRLKRVIRQGDVLTRTTGDEFALLVQGDGRGAGEAGLAEDTAKVAERIIGALREPFQVGDYEYYIGASIGISSMEGSGEEPQTVLQQGDTALRQAKEAGGNTYSVYSGELTERHTRRLSLEGRLHRAVEAGDFVLYFQPIVSLRDGRAVGAEALLRWPQEDGTLLGPAQFIPLAEETGLMVPLGGWVFDAACRQARAWQDAGLDLYISVNLSTHQLLSPSLTSDLEAAMEAHGTPAQRLELEVTEGAMMTDPPLTERILRALHEQGLHIAVDDFGTGYSSLSRLKNLPINTLKIDKDFVLGLPTDANDRTITQSIIQLASNLEMRAVAEGVETEEHKQLLIEMGCPYGQGFLFSEPAPPERLLEGLGGGNPG